MRVVDVPVRRQSGKSVFGAAERAMPRRVIQARPLVFAQPLSERVDKAAARQLAGEGPSSREAGRNRVDAESDVDEAGWWWKDPVTGEWGYYGVDEPPGEEEEEAPVEAPGLLRRLLR